MAPKLSAAAALAKRFEPALLFHEDESAPLPVDPKWYLERCSLWRSSPAPFDDKNDWGEAPQTTFPRVPQVERGQLAALKAEAAGAIWLGSLGSDGLVMTLPQGQRPRAIEERFLDFAGWDPPVDSPNEVTGISNNRHAALDPSAYSGPLKGSKPWYYVEYMTNQELLSFISARPSNEPDLSGLVADNPRLNTPSALVYHFLFPLHLEGLEGCEGAGEGSIFASFAGEWASMAILLDASNSPLYIGLTSRNTGDPAVLGDEEQRVGMTVFNWADVTALGSGMDNDHPLLYVSRGTHGLYVSPGDHTVEPYSAGISGATGSCGAVEKLDDVISGEIVLIPDTPGGSTGPSGLVTIGKVCALVIGWIFLGVEAIFKTDSEFGTTEVDALPSPVNIDHTGTTSFGIILAPQSVTVPGVMAKSQMNWEVSPFTAPAPDSRKYDLVVNRTTQVWWAPRTDSIGFAGRWGPRVTNDPNSRRAGMLCPDFMEVFLEAIAVAMYK